ncbi:MAG: hemerythrin domain-containing protein [Syntrophales bacterium]|nr:hemerythrin domain-containing protein [Syntrophales bacterium]MDD5233173.1 hemerythrin domain-containing protein [Syntrophales bacterium]MDD5533020.1 hemerythrin domain-containing protein [Syntrophales bacterium]HPL63138.1 hemerythrin domain-containing protein [Syntrophales bacterium]
MKPIGPLMWEHRLIERMVKLLNAEVDRIAGKKAVNARLLDQAVDFFRIYADRTHHGKEEEILFRDLAKKKLSPEHRSMMGELISEHVRGREMVGRLLRAKIDYSRGVSGALAEISSALNELIIFYPRHIEKEDKNFFFPSMDYFTPEDQNKMLTEFREFDRKMIHEKYCEMVENFLGKPVPRPPS